MKKRMADEMCARGAGKPDEICSACGERQPLPCWCDTCKRAVAEKRCPLCGLKTRKMPCSA
ncbi:MAG TPA: hypothetical protein VI298_11400 [Geobacteraceae bacterium]